MDEDVKSFSSVEDTAQERVLANYQSSDRDFFSESVAPKLGRLHLDFLAGGLTGSTLPAIYCMSEQGQEAFRQMERIRPYLNWENGRTDDENSKLRDSITSTMKLLCGFSSSNLPIPTASIADDSSSLFLKTDQIYGDMEISNGKVEYFLKWRDGDEEKEILDEEDIDGDRLPKKLLVYLYQRLARYK